MSIQAELCSDRIIIGSKTLLSLNMVVDDASLETFKNEISRNWAISESSRVKDFTDQSRGDACPNTPQLMDATTVEWLIGMVQSELVELAQTVCSDTNQALEMVRGAVGRDVKLDYQKPTFQYEIIAQQADALVDAQYYMHNTACRYGINLSSIFTVVHAANMNKRFPDGKFHRRNDGKVIKPPEWKEPDITAEINRQMKVGSWI